MEPTDLPWNFHDKIAVDGNGCWIWTAKRSKLSGNGKGSAGYGRIRLLGERSECPTCHQEVVRRGLEMSAHRATYTLLVGAIPSDLQLDHLCRNRSCVNPAHLEPVTAKENQRRAHAHQTTCPRGHPYDYVDPNGKRGCKTCRRETAERWRKANPERQREFYRRYHARKKERG